MYHEEWFIKKHRSKSMEQNPSWEAHSRSAGQWITRPLWNPTAS